LHTGVDGNGGGADAATLLTRVHEARVAGVETVFAPAAADGPVTAVLVHLVQALPSRFLAADSLNGALSYNDPLGPERAMLTTGSWPGSLRVGDDPVRNARAVDLATGSSLTAQASEIASGGDRTWTIDVAPPPSGPALVRYVVMQGPRGSSETV